MGAPNYDKCDEIIEIIEQFQKDKPLEFGELFDYVYPEMFVAGLRTDKEAPKKQKWVIKIEGIKGSKTLLTDKKYLIHGYSSAWNACSHEQKVGHIYQILLRIAYPSKDEINALAEKGQDYEYGKLIKPDIEDFRRVIKKLGVDWSQPGQVIPNLLEEDVPEED